MDLTNTTFRQKYEWSNLRDDIRTHIKVCKNFSKEQEKNLKYENKSAKEVPVIPWDIVLIDIKVAYEVIAIDSI